ncbi:C-GCAxxG-C-C family protein [Thermodesulfobacteriota bacterium]
MTIEILNERLLEEIEEATSSFTDKVRGCAPRCISTVMQYVKLADQSAIEVVQKAALPLSGGIMQGYETCGALLGGVMAISIAYFDGKGEEDALREEMMDLNRQCRKYYRTFEKEIGHARCFDIRQVGLGRCFDTADPVEYGRFVEAGGHELCAKVIGKAARLAAESILERHLSGKDNSIDQ